MKLLYRGVERIKSSKCVKDLEKWLVFVQFSISTAIIISLYQFSGQKMPPKEIKLPLKNQLNYSNCNLN